MKARRGSAFQSLHIANSIGRNLVASRDRYLGCTSSFSLNFCSTKCLSSILPLLEYPLHLLPRSLGNGMSLAMFRRQISFKNSQV